MQYPYFEKTFLNLITVSSMVSEDVLSSSSSVAYRLSRNNRLSNEGILFFLKYHPIHVIKTRSTYKCFAGLRSYQLAILLLPQEAKINIVVHKKQSVNIESESSLDPLLSNLVYSLDGIAYETDFFNLWKAAEPRLRKKMLPGLNNNKDLEILLRCSRKKLSRKNKKIISILKKNRS